MPKQLMAESRSSFTGGLNTADNADQLRNDELVDAQNVRLDIARGALAKRTGTRRLHATAFAAGAEIKGVRQWDAPSGKQLVAIAGGNLYHRDQSSGQFSAFTEVVPAAGDEFSTTAPAIFVPFRSTSANAALVLFIASGGKLYTWDGSTLTRIDGTDAAPTADRLVAYHTRLFARDSNFVKHVFWSHIGDGTDWTSVAGDLSSGGNNVVDILTGEAIVALAVVGSSLAVATEDSVVRFTGYSARDIRVEQDTEGIDPTHGAVGPLALRPAEQFLAMLDTEGPFLVEEAGARAMGTDVEPEFDALDRTQLADAVVRYHRGRRELWFAVPASGDSGNQTIYAFSFRQQAWMGPWSYPFAISDLARYESPGGAERVIAGCGDGFVRHMDTGAKDDVLSDGTGGSTYEMIAELPPVFFQTGPMIAKSLKHAIVNVDGAAADTLTLETAFDGQALQGFDFAGDGEGEIAAKRIGLSGQGRRLRVRVRDNAVASVPIVHGVQIAAHNMQRFTS